MNTAARTTCYSDKAQSTKAQRQAAGKYPTREQKLAFKELVSVGEKYLNREALELLASHPHMTATQKARYATLAAQAQ